MSALPHVYDLLIVGAGINGAGIARDAAGRGLSVAICEQGDVAGATSWASSKLIHGGLRYLEQGDFSLVRESLCEREVLLRIAPQLVRPLRFVMPHVPGMRPAWMIRLGLWFYDHLGQLGGGGMSLPPSRAIVLDDARLQTRYHKGYEYSDVQVDDARLVVANLRDAIAHGAMFHPRTRLVGARREAQRWHAELRDGTGTTSPIAARAIINAAGPWAGRVHALLGGRERIALQLVRGSHIVVPRRNDGARAYTLQNADGRIVFVLPFHNHTLIGTTEVRMQDPDEPPHASDAEIDYLCTTANRYLREPVAPQDIIWHFAGVRPLLDEGRRAQNASRASREYRFVLDRPTTADAPLLTIVGGKLTTYRRLAEKSLDKLRPFFAGMGPRWTHAQMLPAGGSDEGQPRGIEFGGGLCERDARYYIEREWAIEADDILWRRTKAGLQMNAAQREAFAAWLQSTMKGSSS